MNAVVKYSKLLSASGGVAPPLNERESFESVTVVKDDAPAAYGGTEVGERR